MVTERQVFASRRAQNALPSPIRKLTPLAERAKAEGVHIYHLNIGQPDLAIPQAIIEGIQSFNGPLLPYAPSNGIAEAVDAWRAYYRGLGMEFDRHELCITMGGSEALMLAMMATCDPGDEILVFEPTYANYFGFAEMLSIRLVPVTAGVEHGFHLPEAATIEAGITPRTRAILFTTPGNPTGTVYSYDELNRLSEIAQRHGLFLIADETYREIVFDGPRDMSAVKVARTAGQTIIVDTVSKRFSATGARVGCIVSHHAGVMEGVQRFAQARLAAPTVEQLAMIPLLYHPEQYVDELAAIYRGRRDVVYGALKNIPGAKVPVPEGAFYILASLPIDDGERFASWLLTDFRLDGETVMISPGDGFYITPGLGKQEVRIAFVLNESALARAMTILTQALRDYPGAQTIPDWVKEHSK